MNRRKKKPAFALGEINVGVKKDSGSVTVHNKPHKISMAQYNVLQTLFEAEDEGYTKEELVARSGHQNAVLIVGHIIKNPILCSRPAPGRCAQMDSVKVEASADTAMITDGT